MRLAIFFKKAETLNDLAFRNETAQMIIDLSQIQQKYLKTLITPSQSCLKLNNGEKLIFFGNVLKTSPNILNAQDDFLLYSP